MNKFKSVMSDAYTFVSEHSTGVACTAVIGIGLLWAMGYFIRSIKM